MHTSGHGVRWSSQRIQSACVECRGALSAVCTEGERPPACQAHLHGANDGGGGAVDGGKQRGAGSRRGHAGGCDCSLFKVEGRADDIVEALQPSQCSHRLSSIYLSVAKHLKVTTARWPLPRTAPQGAGTQMQR